MEVPEIDEMVAAIEPGIRCFTPNRTPYLEPMVMEWVGDSTVLDHRAYVETFFKAHHWTDGIPPLDSRCVVYAKRGATIESILNFTLPQETACAHVAVIKFQNPTINMWARGPYTDNARRFLIAWMMIDLENLIYALRSVHNALGIVLVGPNQISPSKRDNIPQAALDEDPFAHKLCREIDLAMIGLISRHRDMKFVSSYENTKVLETEEYFNGPHATEIPTLAIAKEIFKETLSLLADRVKVCGRALMGPIPETARPPRTRIQEAYVDAYGIRYIDQPEDRTVEETVWDYQGCINDDDHGCF